MIQPTTGTSTDILSLSFLNPSTNETTGSIQIGNQSFQDETEVSFEKDFFVPANGLTFTIADVDISSIINFVQTGYQVQVSINGNTQMIGYVMNIAIGISRTGGTELKIKCQDLLEYMAQGTIYPNMGTNSSTNFHFSPSTTLQTALQTILQNFITVSGNASATSSSLPAQIVSDNSGDLTFATGFSVGISGNGVKKLTTALNHNTTTLPGESYLGYMRRLAKMAGCQLKMSNSRANAIYCSPPTYERQGQPSPFVLTHCLSPATGNIQNNVREISYHFSMENQPSIVLIQASTTNPNGNFYQNTIKGIAINELTAYENNAGSASAGSASQINASIPNVQNAISNLTNGVLGTGYVVSPFNSFLYNNYTSLPIQVDTTLSMPYYSVSGNAHSPLECQYAAALFLAECQDKFLEIEVTVDGWTMPGSNAVWQPDMMVKVIEESFSPGKPQTFNMWIRRVRYYKSRGGGTYVQMTLTLPGTHSLLVNLPGTSS